MIKYALLSFALARLARCHEKQELTAAAAAAAPRARAEGRSRRRRRTATPTDPAAELKPISFDQRSIPEGMRLADQAYAKLNSANSAEVDRLTREQYQTDAVNDFITALAADPYNVKATYGLW